MKTYAYCRVSSRQQVEEGESLEAQRRKLEGQAMILNTTIDEWFIEEGVSGSQRLSERPEGSRMLQALAPGDTVLATKLDRTFRDAEDGLATLRRFKDLGCHLYLLDLGGDATGNGISKLVFTIMAAVAEWERKRIGERLHEGLAHVRASGGYGGGSTPFGFIKTPEGALELREDQQRAIALAHQLRASGASSRAIARKLRAQGHSISHVTVGKILKRRPAP